jgi:hypothetical protein
MVKQILFKTKTIVIIFIYLIGLMIFGEVHPFSEFPMYNSFANWSYAFYITDDNDSLIPCRKLNTRGVNLGHSFYAICNERNIDYGDGLESIDDLNKVGFEMMRIVLNNPENKNIKKLKLWRTYYYYKNDSIIHKKLLIYESNME